MRQNGPPQRRGGGPMGGGPMGHGGAMLVEKPNVVSELALAIVLLTGAGLLVRSVSRLGQRRTGDRPRWSADDGGLAPAGAVRDRTAGRRWLRPPDRGHPSRARRDRRIGHQFPAHRRRRELSRACRFSPRASPSPRPPPTRKRTGPSVNRGPLARWVCRSSKAVRSRPHDTATSTPVIIISRAMAKAMFPNGSPVGKRIRSWRDENVYREIVGVAGDVRYESLAGGFNKNVYVPHTQDAWASLTLVVRTRLDPSHPGGVRAARRGDRRQEARPVECADHGPGGGTPRWRGPG